MPFRRRGALRGLLAGAMLAAAPLPAGAWVLEHVGTFVWRGDGDSFGGLSGFEIGPDGTTFHALNDRAQLYTGSIARDATGAIRAMSVTGRTHLTDRNGVPLPPGLAGDSEGLAIDKNGTVWISFEGLDRVARYDDPDAPATPLPRPPLLPGMGINAGLEALAVRDGTLWTLPERTGAEKRPFQVLTFQDGAWRKAGTIRRDSRWLSVGADFGPDGRFYLLERDFRGIFGFASRVRRMELTEAGPQNEEILLTSRALQYDNLEGIAVWQDNGGIRLTLVADDNFLPVQRTEIVEYRLSE